MNREVKNISELKGIFPNCRASYFGWTLTNALRQKCESCGSGLAISENGVLITVFDLPFTVPEYKIESNKAKIE